MSVIELPKELVSLVHYVELNKSGWWDQAVKHLIISTIWLEGKALAPDQISKSLFEAIKVKIDSEAVAKAIDQIGDAILVKQANGTYKITEEYLKKYEQDLKITSETEDKARDYFIKLLPFESNTSINIWTSFVKNYLIPLVYDRGASVYRVLASGESISISSQLLDSFLKLHPIDTHELLKTIIRQFFDGSDKYVKSYILKLLNGYFFVAASNLDDTTLQAINNLAKTKVTFSVFVDTNFLFSILGLHDNPSNEAALKLIDLIKKINNKVQVRLYVLRPTIEEARGVLRVALNDIKGIRITQNMATAIYENNLHLGVIGKYMEEVAKSKSELDADAYFGPYLEGLSNVLKARGVTLFNEDLEKYRTRQDVIDDIQLQLKHDDQKRNLSFRGREVKTKSYEQHQHDVILWHFCHDRRPKIIESPSDATYWVVTIDYRYLGFDLYKKRSLHEDMSVCLHPSTLIQLLQFWVPRDAAYEATLLGSISLPYIFSDFDSKAEKITVAILRMLSRYENVGDLPHETIAQVLISSALRSKISKEENQSKQQDFVREELFEIHKKTALELKDTKSRAQDLADQIAKRASEVQDLKVTIKQESKKVVLTEASLHKARREGKKVEKELQRMKDDLTSVKHDQQMLISNNRFNNLVFKSVIYLFIAEFLLISALKVVTLFINIPSVLTIVIITLLLFIFTLFTFIYRGNEDSAIAKNPLFKKIDGRIGPIVRFLMKSSFINNLINNIIANMLWSLVKIPH